MVQELWRNGSGMHHPSSATLNGTLTLPQCVIPVVSTIHIFWFEKHCPAHCPIAQGCLFESGQLHQSFSFFHSRFWLLSDGKSDVFIEAIEVYVALVNVCIA